jgi:hypothetical protein
MQNPIRHSLVQEVFRCVHDVERAGFETALVEVDLLRLCALSAFCLQSAGDLQTIANMVPLLKTKVVQDPDSVAIEVDSSRIMIDVCGPLQNGRLY